VKQIWTRLTTSGSRPVARAYHTSSLVDRYMVMYGGYALIDAALLASSLHGHGHAHAPSLILPSLSTVSSSSGAPSTSRHNSQAQTQTQTATAGVSSWRNKSSTVHTPTPLASAGAHIIRPMTQQSLNGNSNNTIFIPLADCFTLDMFRYQPGYFRISREFYHIYITLSSHNPSSFHCPSIIQCDL
jgi:hypothetical protein